MLWLLRHFWALLGCILAVLGPHLGHLGPRVGLMLAILGLILATLGLILAIVVLFQPSRGSLWPLWPSCVCAYAPFGQEDAPRWLKLVPSYTIPPNPVPTRLLPTQSPHLSCVVTVCVYHSTQPSPYTTPFNPVPTPLLPTQSLHRSY